MLLTFDISIICPSILTIVSLVLFPALSADGGGGLVAKSRLRRRWVPGSKPDPIDEPPYYRLWCTLNTLGSNVLPLVWRERLGEGVWAQTSSSDHGSTL
ncbi:hypothetical protein AVEN_152258-1 [Araneus ventricosus]|uniref:Uncharacterized protein n=1 Tax=Araneus ventricosus TaxID=182803 RepID=A0A4Y2NHP3_ARAVE|nr:hypothetical protein AVEN_273567-1 [Araneus ventricosus]GBN38425.1 hypothetical protein AVEN_24742-1 [Araneus ventricosus]GBN38450.1 hypothetical protein AVEN_95132-1 [Araneus ventricosus]GBN38465.1 hypothetical protein AVEN_152258-1 [Araneus ventricosus]